MKRKLNMDEFESFIADEADEVRMYPSDRVWRNIDKELHGEKQWPALTFGAVLTTAVMLATLIFLHPDKDLFEFEPMAKVSTPSGTAAAKHRIPHSDFERSTEKLLQPSPLAKQNVVEANAEPLNENTNLTETTSVNGIGTNLGASLATADFLNAVKYTRQEEELSTPSILNPVFKAAEQGMILEALQPNVSAHLNMGTTLAQTEKTNGFKAEMALVGETNDLAMSAAEKASTPKQVKTQRWGIQYYVTPSSSYRILTEEKYYDKNLFAGGQIPATYYNDVRRIVNQDAGFGAEAGAAITYAATDRLLLKAGLQFNLRRYNIHAFRADLAQASAIRLQQRGAFDTVMATSDIINYASDNPTEIRNQHIQLSMPIGFELAMAQVGKSTFVLSATLQPTYNISQQAWLITSDYQRYVQQQSLVRNFNLNTGIEAFFRFKTKGDLSWQIGPQIRYQMLSSFADIYPVKENLIDYGFKIGLSKTLH